MNETVGLIAPGGGEGACRGKPGLFARRPFTVSLDSAESSALFP